MKLEKEILKKFINIGLKKNDSIFVLINSTKLLKYSNQFPKNFFIILKKFLSKQGTILVQSHTRYTAKYGINFNYESSEPNYGYFSKLFFNDKKSIRSLHPVKSFCAIGKNKSFLCTNNSSSDYGFGSPPEKFLSINGKIFTIGMEIGRSPFMYCAENQFSVPYKYSKLLDIKCLKNNKIVKKDFTSNVKYLHLNFNYNLKKMDRLFKKKFKKKIFNIKGVTASLIDSNDIFNMYKRILEKDIWGLLKKKPYFKKGIIPFDGKTEGKEKDLINLKDV